MSLKTKKSDTRRGAASPECNTIGVRQPRKGTVDLVIAFAGLALILAAVLAGLAACQMEGLDIATPGTGVGTGNPGGGSYTGGARIEIYWDSDTAVNRAGKELFWQYDQTASTHPELAHTISAKVINAPAGFDYLQWTIEPAEAITGNFVRFTSGAVGTSPTGGTPKPNGSSFDAFAGSVPSYVTALEPNIAKTTARLWVKNTNQNGQPGTVSAYIDLKVGGLPPIHVFTRETRRVSIIRIFKADEETAPPLWSVRGGNAMISILNPGTYDETNGEYSGATLDIIGYRPGVGTYLASILQDGVWVETEGLLVVDAGTTWYVGPAGSAGKYGFRPNDIVTLDKCQTGMTDAYTGRGGVVFWPLKGTFSEQHAVVRFTGRVTDPVSFPVGTGQGYNPMYIDLMNNLQTGTVRIGQVIVDSNQTFTLEGIEVEGLLNVNKRGAVRMVQARSVISGGIGLEASNDSSPGGVFTMDNGAVNNAQTDVQRNATFTMKDGTYKSAYTILRAGGAFIMEKGSFKNTGLLEVSKNDLYSTPGRFTIKTGTIDAANIDVSGEFTMDGGTIGTDGVIGITKATVKSGGRLWINAGTIGNKTNIEVKTGGGLQIKRGVVIESSFSTNGIKVYRNGQLLDTTTTPRWPPAALSSAGVLTADYDLWP